MRTQNLHQLFVSELQDVYNSEHLIIESLPLLIEVSSQDSLKEALSHHLEETRNQVERLKKVFSILNLPVRKKMRPGMDGILKEAGELASSKTQSATLDAAIIDAAQKVEHYEMASYGTLCSFAKHLNLDDEVSQLLHENLKEEKAADKKLSKIAEGTIFSTGVNEEAVAATAHSSR